MAPFLTLVSAVMAGLLRSGFSRKMWRCRCSPCRRDHSSQSASAASAVVPVAALATGGTVFPTASVERAARQLTLEESSAGTASSDAVAEAAPLTGDTAAPDASVERAARQLTLE